MLTIEKDSKAEEICIHGSPENLREFAKKFWAIAEEAESNGKAHEHLMTPEWAGTELTNELQGESSEFSIINKLTIYGWGN